MAVFAAITYKGQNCSKDGMFDSCDDLIIHLWKEYSKISQVVLIDDGEDVVFSNVDSAVSYLELWFK
ncbi:hypothetical protein Erwinia_phage_Papaline_00070 [Erwinia phage Papaline]|nr:hypothetical protein Erwinia_phage_Orgeat_00054 [Erwinia phage Orgeat]WJN64538.1 hypothetical protein Erwinia_phage_Papaline_00070 [Erwinia phage Papaline]